MSLKTSLLRLEQELLLFTSLAEGLSNALSGQVILVPADRLNPSHDTFFSEIVHKERFVAVRKVEVSLSVTSLRSSSISSVHALLIKTAHVSFCW